ncbi:UDP-2,4-diacetamido-2,4,6-trideoxy-beta-L-altropyranose hydrolase [Peptostreptococcaceae bacterium AGR-M142]
MKILFRVDAGKNIGFGHMNRTMSIANELKNKNIEFCYLTRFQDGIDFLKRNNVNCLKMENLDVELRTQDNFNEESLNNYIKLELEQIKKLKAFKKFDTIIVDSYFVNEFYFLELKKLFKKVVYIDDLNNETYPVDILINGNIYANDLGYKKFYKDTKLLLGSNYNLINKKYVNLKRKFNSKLKEILITTGGADPNNLMINFIDFILENNFNEDIKINIIIGKSFEEKNKIKIREKLNKKKNFFIYEDIDYMDKLMLNSDLAISSAGSTIYELMACGTHIVYFSYANNQKYIINYLKNKNIGSYIGNKETIDFDKLYKILKNYNAEIENIISGRKKQMAVMSHYGARNIVDILLK